MKKRLLSLLLALVTIFSFTAGTAGMTAQAANETKLEIYINGEKLVYDEETYGYAYITPAPSRTMIPVRIISESIGLKVEWDNATRTAIVHGPLGKVEMQNGQYYLLLNGEKRTSDQPVVELKNGRTFVALRVFLNALGISDEDIGWQPGIITIKHSIGSVSSNTETTKSHINGMIKGDQYDPEALAEHLSEKLADVMAVCSGSYNFFKGFPMGVSTADPVHEGAVGFSFHDDYIMDGFVKLVTPDEDNGDEWKGNYLAIVGFDTEMMMACFFGANKALEDEFEVNQQAHPDDHTMLYALNNILKELVCDEARELIVRGYRDNCLRYSDIFVKEEAKGWQSQTYQMWEEFWATKLRNVAFKVTDDIIVHFAASSLVEVYDMDYYNSNIALGYDMSELVSPSAFPWFDSSNASYRVPNSVS